MRVRCALRCAAGLATGSTGPSAATSSSTAHSEHSTQHAFRTRDITLRVPSKDHLLRVSFCSTRHLLAETIRRHDLLRSTGAQLDFLQLLGTQLTFTNLLAASLEGEERVETRLTAEEATILTEALALGESRCYLRPAYNAELEAQGLPTFPLRVNRILYRQERPFSSLVHADLAELLQAPSPPTSAATTAGEAAEAAVPFSLFQPGLAARVPLEAWQRFFSYNGSLHAYNYLRRSDACVPAVWLHAGLDGAALQRGGCMKGDGSAVSDPASRSHDDEQAHQRALRRAVSHSVGIMVTPLAAGAAMDRRVGALNRALMEAAAQLYASSASEVSGSASASTASPLAPLLARCAETHTACQHLLSLVSGDHDGAHAAAVAARQYSADPAAVAAVVDPIRRALGVADLTVPLSAGEALRTGLDFFCRCSKQNILDSLVSAPASALASLRESGSTVHCSFCGRQHTIGEADWSSLEAQRGAASP